VDEIYANEIIEKLRSLASQALKENHHQRYFELLDAAEALARWRDAGMEGELPVDLWKFGITVPTEAPTPSEVECRGWLQEGLDAAEAGDLKKAIDLFQKVIEHCSGEVKSLAEAHLSDARAELSKQIEEWRKKAREAREAGDLEAAERAYRELLLLNPEDEEARGAYEEQARYLLSKHDRQLSEIEEGLRIVERLRSVGIVDEELEKLYERGDKERVEILKRSGRVPPVPPIEYMEEIEPRIDALEKRKKELEQMIEDGILEYREKETGKIRRTVEELDRTHKLLDETWERYRDFCKEKAHEYLARAEEDLREGFPKAAEEKLRMALKRFRALPDEERRVLEDKLTEVQDLTEEECRGWLQEGLDAAEAGNLRKAIDLFQRVIERCSGEVRSLAEMHISDARAELSRRIEGWRKKAREAREAGDLKAAERAYRELQRLNPEDEEARGALEEIARGKALEEEKLVYEEQVRPGIFLVNTTGNYRRSKKDCG